ncbi:MAG: lyase family protein, partial [Gammaproteobacteria bacterium]
MSANDKTRGEPWSGRFAEPATGLVQRFTASVSFDRRLAAYDIEASLAHARMLEGAGIIGKADLAAIEKGLAQIRSEVDSGAFPWSEAHEDVHFNIERRLIELAGEPGKRLHTARSRNDQVATDVRLYLRDAIDQILSLVKSLQRALLDLAEEHADAVMPGYTHLQVAQPVTLGHHLLAYFEMLARDAQRLGDCHR